MYWLMIYIGGLNPLLSQNFISLSFVIESGEWLNAFFNVLLRRSISDVPILFWRRDDNQCWVDIFLDDK